MDYTQTLNEFCDYLKKIEAYSKVNSLLFWDSMQKIPKAGSPYRANTRGVMAAELFQLQTSGQMRRYLDQLTPVQDKLSDFHKALLRVSRLTYEQNAGIPKELFQEFEGLKAEAMDAWDTAYKNNDYDYFEPYLKKLITLSREITKHLPFNHEPYNALLNLYEEDISTEALDKMFGEIKAAIIPLIKQISDKQTSNPANRLAHRPEFLSRYVPKAAQEKLCLRLCKILALDESKAMLYETTHPFSFTINTNDVRFSTRYDEHDFASAIFSTLHEAGHSIYSLNIPEELNETILGGGASAGFHESQSRFYENVIGRGYEFVSLIYNDIMECLGEYIGPVSLQEMYEGFNYVTPSLIRVEADELTYTLHIIMRYEMEREFINNGVDTARLPIIWNEKIRDYFGLEVPNNKLGILQDIQWSAGRFGGFVSYALGNVYNAQLLNNIKKEIDFNGLVSRGEFHKINEYLKERVHKYSQLYTAAQQIKMITGEEPTPKYFIDYLTEKFSKLYLN